MAEEKPGKIENKFIQGASELQNNDLKHGVITKKPILD
jgi:hypothetical protein